MHAVNVESSGIAIICWTMMFLAISMYFDVKEQKIPAIWLWGNLVIGIVYRVFFYEGENEAGTMAALLPGISILIMAKLSHQMGEGDGYLIMVTGCFLPIQNHIKIILIAFWLAAGSAIGMVVIRKERGNKRIPFAPFVFVAFLFAVWGKENIR